MEKQIEINPFALLAAVLKNLDLTHKVRVKPDDTSPEVDMDLPVVSLAKNEDAILCKFPLVKLVEVQHVPFDVKLRIENGEVIVYMQKAALSTGILAADGKKVMSEPTKPLTIVQ